MAAAGNWCLIESDPGVFTELIKEFGCTGIQVEELWSLEKSLFDSLKPVYGLIFLFKWLGDEQRLVPVVSDSRLNEIFFAQQVIQNACASQAIINLLLNCESDDMQLGDMLSEFKAFAKEFDPATKGLCLSNAEQIRKVHNSFSRHQLFEMDMKLTEKEDVYHFISYVPFNGRVYELDGLLQGPVDHGKIPDNGEWLDIIRPVIEQRMQKYSQGEIRFNLMAVIADKKAKYQKQLDVISQNATDSDSFAEEIYRLQALIADEETKLERYHRENVRRRHNYIPFIVELLKILAADGKLVDLVKEAKDKAKKKEESKTQNINEKSTNAVDTPAP